MGMSASQVRLLTITARIHDLENEAQRIQNQKLLLANESDEAYQQYLAALEQKNIQTLVFNNDTGTFNWNEVGVQGLCDNGYALKVKYLTAPTFYTSNANIWNGITTESTLLETYEILPPGGFINEVTQVDTTNFASVTAANLADASITNYVITSVADLNTLATYVNTDSNNTCANKTFVLANNIDASNFNYGIGVGPYSGQQKFEGTLNGNGYEIYNLHRSLFRCSLGTIKNLCITNSTIDTYNSNVNGFFAIYGGGNIENCYVKNSTLTAPTGFSNTYSGGFVGEACFNLDISSSYISNDVTITGNGNATMGGFIGQILGSGNPTVNITDSFMLSNSISAATTAYNGAYVGISCGNTNIQNSYTSSTNDYVDGIYSGNTGTLTINGDCSNPSGTIDPVTNLTIVNETNNTGLYNYRFNVTIDGTQHEIVINGTPNMTIEAFLAELQTQLNTVLQVNNVNVSINNNRLCISCVGHTVSDINLNANFVTNFNDRLGLRNGGTVSCDEWIYCHSFAEVAAALGCSSNVSDSPAFLRELIANAMAIVCTYEDVEEEGETVRHYHETSVSVDTHIKEQQNDSEMARAEAEYESALRKIDQKDKKYDKELAAIENQRTAVKEEFDTLKTCIKDNIDRTFKIFS